MSTLTMETAFGAGATPQGAPHPAAPLTVASLATRPLAVATVATGTLAVAAVAARPLAVATVATGAASAPVAPGAAAAQMAGPVPCAARPSTGFIHLDGPCRCFFGGPAPEFAAQRRIGPLGQGT